MQIYIIRHASKIDEEIAGTAFFSMENAEKELNRLAQHSLEAFHRPDAKLETLPGTGADIIVNGVRIETFRVITLQTEDDRHPDRWDFVYDEEQSVHEGVRPMGVISNGRNFLFFEVQATEGEDEADICHVYDSISMNPESEVCSYPWTADNDSALLNALDNLADPRDFCGENCPLRTLEFPDKE